jgi:hypothetical protein
MPRITVLLVTLLAAAVVQAELVVSDGEVEKEISLSEVTSSQVAVNPANGHTYEYIRLSSAISWHDALTMAENVGGYLATITDASEAAIVTSLLSDYGDEAWLGASDETQEGVWTWANGEPWGYTNWYPGEPNAGYPNEDYLLAQNILGGRWVDVWDNNYGLIIESDTVTPNIIFNPHNGHSYEYLKLPGDVSWHEAVAMAENAGGYLATITDSTEAAIVTTFLSMPGNDATWLGGSDEAEEGVWAWVTGEPWDYTNWYPGEPNAAYPTQDYLEAQHALGGRWVDVEDECDGLIIESETQPQDRPSLIYPTGDDFTLYEMLPAFTWTEVAGDVTYRLELSLDSDFTFVMLVDGLEVPAYQSSDSLEFSTHYWWRVTAVRQDGFSVSEPADFWTWTLGDVNNSHTVSLADIMRLIDYLYISKEPIEPARVGDMNGDCDIRLGDVMWLVAKLFISQIELRVGCE